MGAGAGGYVKITLQTLLSSVEATGHLHRISELSFAGAPVPDDAGHQPPRDVERIDPGPPPAAVPAGKLGLGGVKPRDVTRFNLFARLDDGSLAGMGVRPSRAVTGELEDAFDGPWAGFAVALAPEGGRFRLVADITLRLRGKQRARKPFQVVPVVMAFGTDRFVEHYLLSVIVAQHTGEKVDTSVTQPFS
jgi:hypothetical protein